MSITVLLMTSGYLQLIITGLKKGIFNWRGKVPLKRVFWQKSSEKGASSLDVLGKSGTLLELFKNWGIIPLTPLLPSAR